MKKNFSQNQLATLRSIGSTPAEDSNFVLNCVRILYDDNLQLLNQRSLTGRKLKGQPQTKSPMTPQKRIVIQNIYQSRLGMMCGNADEREKRLKKLNVHIKNAIKEGPPRIEEKTVFQITDTVE